MDHERGVDSTAPNVPTTSSLHQPQPALNPVSPARNPAIFGSDPGLLRRESPASYDEKSPLHGDNETVSPSGSPSRPQHFSSTHALAPLPPAKDPGVIRSRTMDTHFTGRSEVDWIVPTVEGVRDSVSTMSRRSGQDLSSICPETPSENCWRASATYD